METIKLWEVKTDDGLLLEDKEITFWFLVSSATTWDQTMLPTGPKPTACCRQSRGKKKKKMMEGWREKRRNTDQTVFKQHKISLTESDTATVFLPLSGNFEQ